MVPCVDDTTADMFAFWGCLLWTRGLLDVDGQFGLGPKSVRIAGVITVVSHVYTGPGRAVRHTLGDVEGPDKTEGKE